LQKIKYGNHLQITSPIYLVHYTAMTAGQNKAWQSTLQRAQKYGINNILRKKINGTGGIL
jgi:hypothetical protein